MKSELPTYAGMISEKAGAVFHSPEYPLGRPWIRGSGGVRMGQTTLRYEIGVEFRNRVHFRENESVFHFFLEK